MPYLGRSTDGFGVRDRFVFTASGSETSLSGADDNSRTLKYQDGTYIDVFMNGVLLLRGTDYNTTTANTIGGLASLAANDIVEIITYDVFSVADTVSQTGGTYTGDVTFNSSSTVTIQGSTAITELTVDSEVQREERSIMLEGTDSDFSNEGSALLLDASASGENAGECVSLRVLVKRRACPPKRETCHKSFSLTKTICFLKIVGCVKYPLTSLL